MLDAISRCPRQMLFVLDDLSAAADFERPATAKASVPVTTRRSQLGIARLHEYSLPALSDDDALVLVRHSLTELSDTDAVAARELCRALDCSPRAVSLAAHQMRRLCVPVEAYWKSIRGRDRLEELEKAARDFRSPTGHDASVLNTFCASLDALAPRVQRLLHMASCLHSSHTSVE